MRLLLLLACLLLAPYGAAAQISVTATVDETTIGTEETVRFHLEVKGGTYSNVGTPIPPDAEGLDLVQRIPSTQQNISYINGKLEQSLTFSWRFAPTGTGSARIGAARIPAEGRTLTTAPIRITVVPQADRSTSSATARRPGANTRRSADLPEITDTDVFIKANPTSRQVFQNEQLTVAYDLYFRHGVQLRSSRLADSWDAEGFWREDLDVAQRATMRQEVINGLRYNVVTLKRVAVFPTRAGELNIEPLRIETEVALPTRSSFNAFFLNNATRFQPATIASAGISIRSKPLPDPSPDAFSGAVGTFSLEAATDRTEIQVGEPFTYTVSFSGRGNIATLDAPALTLPAMVEQYGVEASDQINRSRSSISGSKAFAYTLIPRSSGTLTLPPVQMAFLNPSTGRFTTLESRPVVLTVTGTASTAGSKIVETAFPANDVAALLLQTNLWRSVEAQPLHQQTWPYVVLVLPLLLLVGLFTYRRHAVRLQTDAQFARNRRAHPLARKHLKDAERLLLARQHQAFYEEISRAVRGFVGDRLNVSVLGLTHAQLDRTLAGHQVPNQTRSGLQTLLEECDLARFSPTTPTHEVMETATERAATLITDLDAWLTQQPPNVAAT